MTTRGSFWSWLSYWDCITVLQNQGGGEISPFPELKTKSGKGWVTVTLSSPGFQPSTQSLCQALSDSLNHLVLSHPTKPCCCPAPWHTGLLPRGLNLNLSFFTRLGEETGAFPMHSR